MTQDEPLREDVRLLGDLLGLTIQQQAGSDIYEIIENIRQLGKTEFADDQESAKKLIAMVSSLPDEQLLPVTKAFSQFLNFANIAEQYHRIRRGRGGDLIGGFEETINKFIDKKLAPAEIFRAICKLDIQLVLTSHPTEVKRRIVMRKYERISKALQRLDTQVLTPHEISSLTDNIQGEMTSVWLTPEVHTQKPSPVDEAKWGFAIIESSIWHAIPNFLRELDRVIGEKLGFKLPLHVCPIKIDSWLGGDRDGNPNVTPSVTRRVIYIARWFAADLLIKEIKTLRDNLSFEPYYEQLQEIQTRLQATSAWAQANFGEDVEPSALVYLNKEELLEPLMDCYQNLIDEHAEVLAEGHLSDIIRKIYCFGLSLVRTDIRQEACEHTKLITAVVDEMELGDYEVWSESKRCEFLIGHLKKPPKIDLSNLENNSEIQDLVKTFKIISKVPSDSLGSYIISMATHPSDVLAVSLLQKLFGVQDPLPVVPLFETYDDLQNAPDILDSLLKVDVYRNSIGDYQQVMIGYSDSAKDVGILAAAWAQYHAQESMMSIAKNHGINLVFFHGRGGSLGRGGWPTHEAILAQPPGSIKGAMRVTQQGEVIQNRFAIPEIAERTFTVYATSVLEAELLPPIEPEPAWRDLMQELSDIAAEQYRNVIVDSPKFLQYFQEATPTNELKDLAIGSRPSSRGNSDKFSKLRAIPWIFAWTQNRFLLPSWVGVGSALSHALDTDRGPLIQTMYTKWPFFHSLMGMLEMVLAKADVSVAKYYETRLVKNPYLDIGANLREQFRATEQTLLEILKQKQLLSNNYVLDRSIKLRNPYLLPLHLLQVELLYRVREGKDTSADIKAALFTSIAGIAAGMRNTG